MVSKDQNSEDETVQSDLKPTVNGFESFYSNVSIIRQDASVQEGLGGWGRGGIVSEPKPPQEIFKKLSTNAHVASSQLRSVYATKTHK